MKTVAIAVVALSLIACSFGSGKGNEDPPAPPPPPPATTAAAQSPTPVKTTERPGAGSIRTTFRDTAGSDRVTCGSINTEFRVIADFGWIEWTAVPVSSDPTFQNPGNRITSITVTPSSGKLDKDQSVVVKVRGNYSGGTKFWIRAQETVGGSSSMNGVAFSC